MPNTTLCERIKKLEEKTEIARREATGVFQGTGIKVKFKHAFFLIRFRENGPISFEGASFRIKKAKAKLLKNISKDKFMEIIVTVPSLHSYLPGIYIGMYGDLIPRNNVIHTKK